MSSPLTGRLADRPAAPSPDDGRAHRRPGEPVNRWGLPVEGLYAYGQSSLRWRPAIPPTPPRRRTKAAPKPAARPPDPPAPPAAARPARRCRCGYVRGSAGCQNSHPPRRAAPPRPGGA